MQRRYLFTQQRKKLLLFGITVLAIFVFVFTLIHATLYSSTDEISLPQNTEAIVALRDVKNAQSSSDLSLTYPTQLVIPSININAKITEVGITSSGNMATPHNLTDIGWYKYGTVPGNVGSAVLAGHVDNGLSLPGVFYNLHKMQVGDDIYIIDKNGQKLSFKVIATDIYGYKDAPADLIFNDKSGKKIRLITCMGNWVPKDKTAEQRFVVTGVLQE